MEPVFITEHQDGDSKSAGNPECTKLVDIGDIEIEIGTPPLQSESARNSMSRSAVVIAIIKSWTKQYEYRTYRKTLLTVAILAIVLIVVLLNVSDFTGSKKTGDSAFESIKNVFSDIDPERFWEPETDETKTNNDEYFLQKDETSLEADPIQTRKLEPSTKGVIFCGTDRLNANHASKHSKNINRKRSRKQNKNKDSVEMELTMTIETADLVENLKYTKLTAASQSPSLVSLKSLLQLNQDAISSETSSMDDPSVTELNIDEGISPALLKKIVEKYHSLEKLTIHMDQFCSRKSEQNNENKNQNRSQENSSQEQRLPSIVFNNVVSFTVQNKYNPDRKDDGNFDNDFHCPDLYKWVFTWKFPQLKNLEINSINLDEGLFESVHGLLEETKQTMSTITVLNSYICDDCFFSDVEYAQIQMVKILGRRETPFSTFAEDSPEMLDEYFY